MLSRQRVRPILVLSIAVVLALASVFSVAAPSQAQGPACSPAYIVKPGDNLFRIGLAVNVTWVVLQQINGIANPNYIFAGEVLCLPGSGSVGPITIPTAVPPVVTPVVTPVPTSVPPASGVVLPPPGVFPSITLSTYQAGPGDTITITGINFPTNSTVNIYLAAPLGSAYTAASGTAQTTATGTLSIAFVIPGDIGGQPIHGSPVGIQVKDPVTGYFAYNFFYNTKP